jgi:starch synthase
MHVVMIAPEVVPFSKTGGLGDVLGSLPRALGRAGAHVAVIAPLYRCTWDCGQPLRATSTVVSVPIGQRRVFARLFVSQLPRSGVPVYLLDCPDYYDRPGLYGEQGKDYRDNAERFIFLARASLEAARALDLRPDILHVHDWQAALVPVYVKELYRPRGAGFERTATVLTIHNLAYQGHFWHWDMLLTGLDWKLFNWRQLEFQGHLNFLKAGIVYADFVTTVSKTYAQEIQTPELGCGLDGVLRWKRASLRGIVNGVDYEVWDPRTDPYLPAHYDLETFAEGKRACKLALQAELGLEQRLDRPLVAQIGRLDPQKGWDLVQKIVGPLLERGVQWVVLGTGRPELEQWLRDLASRRAGQVAAVLSFDDPLAHRIEAGADLFLMPSRYEPCGLNQLYSLRYGTVPVVRATGGLADTVVDATPETLAAGTATGFVFTDYRPEAFLGAVERALELWKQPVIWQALVRNGMRQDWSWDRSAREYLALYDKLLSAGQPRSEAEVVASSG